MTINDYIPVEISDSELVTDCVDTTRVMVGMLRARGIDINVDPKNKRFAIYNDGKFYAYRKNLALSVMIGIKLLINKSIEEHND